MRRMTPPLSAATIVAVLAPALALANEPTPGTVLAAYTVLAPDKHGATVAIARAIVQGIDSSCPRLTPLSGSAASVATVARKNPDPKNFPIVVCEAIVSTGMQVAGGQQRVPGPPQKADALAVVGDSGCKPADQDGCTLGSKSWPFQQIAHSAAAAKPDIVLHMGDYNYRGTPGHVTINGQKQAVYDAGDNTGSVSCQLAGPYHGQNSQGSADPDRWNNWWLDFFQPAAELLAAAPWVIARGNHELCSRAGPGWFYLLAPGSDSKGVETGQPLCPSAESDKPLLFGAPYRLDLPGLSVLVLDSANACDQGDLHQAHFDRQFESIQKLLAQAPDKALLTLVSHRPLWAVDKADDTTAPGHTDPSGAYAIIDQTLQRAYRKYPLPRSVDLVLSGHMHRFQAIGFARDTKTPYPDQLVVGNSGVSLAHNHPAKPFLFPIDGLTGTGFGLSEFGYMTLAPSRKHGWKGTLRDPGGNQLASCEGGKGAKKTGPCVPKS
jgi:hypothetical protein